jgi:hypothetical protein
LIVAVGAVAALAPSDLGVVVPTAAPSLARFLLGWSWQIPLEHELRHRLVPSADLLLRGGAAWRGRLGYRYAGPHAFAGAGVALDRAAMSLSPELGVRFAHADSHPIVTDTSLHLLARADIAPESGRVRGVTVMLGWNLF